MKPGAVCIILLIYLGTGFTSAAAADLISPDIHDIRMVLPDIPAYSPDTLLVQFDTAEYSPSSVQEAHAGIGAEILIDYAPLQMEGLALVSLPNGTSVDDGLSYYQSLPSVRYAEPNYYRMIDRIPDDPDLWRQWGLINTGQVYRPNISPGSPGADIHASHAWNTSTNASGVIIGLIDTGIDYHHPDLVHTIWTDPESGTHGYDTVTGTLDPMDLFGHGTHCAGVIGAEGNNSVGTSGVNWNAQIMGVSFSGSFGMNTVADSVTAILWASRHGAEILSCSYGGPYYSQAEYDAIVKSGALVVCSAGNSAEDLDLHPHYPASYNLSTIIAVAATDSSDTLAEFSCYGNRSVDVGAPGVDIYSSLVSVYQPSPIWYDPVESLENWTIIGNWTVESPPDPGSPASVVGTINSSLPDSSLPLTLSLARPMNLSGISNPMVSYDWTPFGVNYSYSVEMSANGKIWEPVDQFELYLMFSPEPITRRCKVPVDMQGGPLYIRFNANGTICSQKIQNITLSDGLGNPISPRWGYQNGTSMACPHVSGIAGMLASTYPDASPGQIKDAILSSADHLASLEGKTVSGGRVNLSAALEYMKSGPWEIPLEPGWNPVSFSLPIAQGSDTAGQVFAPLANETGHSILTYDGPGWRTIRSDEEIHPLLSYWIWTGSPLILTPVPDLSQKGTCLRNLSAGWNGFGKIHPVSAPAKDELAGIRENWTYLIGYNSMIQQYEEPIIRGGQGNSSDCREIRPDAGYWLYVRENCTYSNVW